MSASYSYGLAIKILLRTRRVSCVIWLICGIWQKGTWSICLHYGAISTLETGWGLPLGQHIHFLAVLIWENNNFRLFMFLCLKWSILVDRLRAQFIDIKHSDGVVNFCQSLCYCILCFKAVKKIHEGFGHDDVTVWTWDSDLLTLYMQY